MKMAMVLSLALVAGCDSCGKTPNDPSVSATPAVKDAGMRSPAQIRSEGNHLAGSGSLYLQMHAHNPVDWYPWGPEAIAQAKLLDRPIFLSIGYSSCHWCHVMEEEVFSKDDAAEYLNAHFVAIKVDREERPDLDAIFIDAVETLTGSGGWPLTVFLTPSQKPFYGGTYFPHDAFLKLLGRVTEQYGSSRAELETRGADVAARIAKVPDAGTAPKVRADEVVALARRAVENVDPTWGGFRGRMKFPNPVKWAVVLDAYRKSGDPALFAALRSTLDQMASGGIHDQIGGGFHRYTVDSQWVVPHFEKMLYVNAELASVYLGASAALGDPRYVGVAKDTLDFLLRDMLTPGGGFAASLDADSGGHEGTYYVFTPKELGAAAGEADGKALATLLGATDAGNFEGSNVLTRRSARDTELSPVLEKWRSALLATRQARPRPRLDTKVITSWNGMAISALARGYAATRDVRYRDAAIKAADFIGRAHRTADGALARASNDGHAEGRAGIDDYAAFCRGLVDLFEVTGDVATLTRALALIDEADAALATGAGGWYSAPAAAKGDETAQARRIELFDSEEPSGYATMLGALSRLAALTGSAKLYAALDKALVAYAEAARHAEIGMAGYLDAALLEEGPLYDVVIAGGADDARTAALLASCRSLAAPWTVMATVPSSGPTAATEALMPALAGKSAKGAPLAYVCIRGACKLPTADPAALRTQLLAGWSK